MKIDHGNAGGPTNKIIIQNKPVMKAPEIVRIGKQTLYIVAPELDWVGNLTCTRPLNKISRD